MSGVLKTEERNRFLWKPTKRPMATISTHQAELLKAIWETGSVKGAADQLGITEHTVWYHTGDMRNRLGLAGRSTIELLRWGVRHGWLTLLLLFCLGAGNPHYASVNLFQNPSGMGYLSGAGTYYVGTTVTIATIPSNTAYKFVHWTDLDTNATRQIKVPKGGQSFTAYYVKIPPPVNYPTNALAYWIPPDKTNPFVYEVSLVPGAHFLTSSTNYLFRGLTNGQAYQVWVQAAYSNNPSKWSSNSCILNFTAGSGLNNFCTP